MSAAGAIAGFADPLTRVLLAGDGFTMSSLEAILGAPLLVRVRRQIEVPARRLPDHVTDALRVPGAERVLLRRSALVTADQRLASVNHVVAVRGPATATGLDDVRVPIGAGLIARGVAQRRRILWAGLRRWPDGRPCAARSYLMVVQDRPLCFVRESFDPDLVPPDHLLEPRS
ncbi:hypothetical protein [Nocardia farcinica]|uniref:hypothetical protein n=1 Tax=Nocardia farcinica TaxID=37329 RepID=UPI0037A459E4